MNKTPLQYAIDDLGIQEQPKNSNNVKFNTWFYGKAVSGSQYSWCMSGVQYWYNEAGCTLPYKTASCSALLNWYKKNKPQCIVKSPQPNDIIIYSFGHTGIFEKWYNNSNFYAIEGNTGVGNDSNGGEVMRRLRDISLVTAFIRPEELKKIQQEKEGKTMDIVKGVTINEKRLVENIQISVNANPDNEIGTQTISDIACKLNSKGFPYTLKIYDAPVIIAEDIVPFAGNGSCLADWGNCINGSFYANGKPCSILVQDGIVKQKYACHANYGKTESVLYKTKKGEVYITGVTSADYLPSDTIWAVGGMGLLDRYNPVLEGFCKLTANGKTEDFSDVLRKTNHTMLGYKNKHLYLVYCQNMDSIGVNKLAQKLGLEKAIMLDGGHIAGIMGTEDFAKINTKTNQYYIIQAKGR